MAQTRGILPASSDNTKKTVKAIITPRTEATPGLMRTRNLLKGIRSSTLPKAPKGRRG
jgi:hypothetical protein